MKKINKHITIKDQTIAVEIRDRETDCVWVFLHGWGADKSVWAPVTNKLSATTITVDLPGFGQSSDLTEPKNTEDYSRYIQQLVHKLGHANVILVGHSFGGQVATAIAAKQPAWLSGLVLVSAAVVRDPEPKFLSTIGHWLSPLFQLPMLNKLKGPLYDLIGADRQPRDKNLKQTMETVLREDKTHALANIIIPTYVIWGNNDQITKPEQAQTIIDHLSQATLTMLDGGHHIFVDSPDDFIAELKTFRNELKL